MAKRVRKIRTQGDGMVRWGGARVTKKGNFKKSGAKGKKRKNQPNRRL